MKILTIHQPWATLIAIGQKRYETRSWSTSYRGLLGIHAGVNTKYVDLNSKNYICAEDFYFSTIKAYSREFINSLDGKDTDWLQQHPFMSLGMIVATANLVDCIPTEKIRICREEDIEKNKSASVQYRWISEKEAAFGDYSPRRFAWALENVVKLDPPIPAKGKQGLWDCDLINSGADQ